MRVRTAREASRRQSDQRHLMEALAFAGEGKVRCHFSSEKLEQINAVFDQMRAGAIEGPVVLKV